jgi:uncharacterized RDD family membrane protein YckC
MSGVPAEPPASEPVPPEPVPPQAAGGEDDLLGVRSGAAMIDLALLSGLFIVLSVTIGEASVGGGGFSFSLNSNADGVLLLGLVLVYYFALEATIGQTVGKLLVGVRVVGRDRGRPSVLAVAIRTLLRVVDWLPVLYLVGFISMLATGARQQRLGDLVARTGIARAVPLRHRGRAVAVVVSTLVLVVAGSVTYAAATDEDGGARTYRRHGVSFAYPAGWDEGTLNVKASSGGGGELWEAVVGTGTGDLDFVAVEAFRLSAPITAENLDAVKPEVGGVVQQLFEQADGTVQAGPDEITVGGKPGLRASGTGTIDGTPVGFTVVFVFDGTTQYFFSCEHTAGKADEIERGCQQILRTFRVD